MPEGKYTSWSEETHHDILMATFAVMKPTGAQWKLITEQLHGLGYGFSANALKQHLQKLKRKEKGGTPKKATASAPAKGGAAPAARKRKAAEQAEDDDDGEDDDIVEVPTPKKTRGSKASGNANSADRHHLWDEQPGPPEDLDRGY
ncbi:Uu.00g065960.m01.CDS01 [Anthostomella pinea]|uniref:Uu.00g065960.m01.CDS01 n=1 Tax=Anthostomella pinea TaxID=933095 RepID=A0AAI8YNC7_9PEZI|nr:Uu.00g065960.m01.CDS01 [Anthostomella pinea]